ncbi:hypothetical protein SDC9_199404 [bioreactor metagenome]|uniref:Uncharacterized protein n=1 Tax=bioreactor metagenome TaxID=1076179 RepID=A0A645IKC4_9ZZZZ
MLCSLKLPILLLRKKGNVSLNQTVIALNGCQRILKSSFIIIIKVIVRALKITPKEVMTANRFKSAGVLIKIKIKGKVKSLEINCTKVSTRIRCSP